MKLQRFRNILSQKAERIGSFVEGVGVGLVIAYFISAFSHALPGAVLYSGFGVMIVAAWLPVWLRRGKAQTDSGGDMQHD